ncbi:hypothetical protein P9211_16181 [Prochlorococcus marinus str. MIT 9211]|uniref:DUF3493 domain-containing protein n=1 Tax=Prochlorococcus marinus (strain MIT 9211) TaxID=93059 RepID=A9BCI7_PROM4|nr:hypothetical protein P9211_16181 [Prochlorococcus marinus str. MIT 9211]
MTLDPKVRKKLLKESRNPFLGIRRILWISLLGSAGIGLVIMIIRLISGDSVLFGDLGIQITAFLVLGLLTIFDRRRSD